MKDVFILGLVFIVSGCLSSPPSNNKINANSLNEKLVKELSEMVNADQEVQMRYTEIASGELTFKEYEETTDSVYRSNHSRLITILKEHGYPNYKLVGQEGSHNFWLMVQHCDFDIPFQQKVADLMEEQVKQFQADPADYGYLRDRIAVNSGDEQLYGTQVDYDTDSGRAIPKPIADSINVDVRRKSIHLPPLYQYLNDRIDDFWAMNPELIKSNGLSEKPYYQQ